MQKASNISQLGDKKTLLIVESPAKCKTIAGYLPKNFEVIATYGHIKSLKKSNGSVVPEDDFNMVWEYNNPARMSEIIKKAKNIDKQNGKIILCPDPDREGAAIAHHLYTEIRPEVKCTIDRAVFNEISKAKIVEAILSPAGIDHHKVDSYFARVAIDYLMGYTLSPFLWKKLKNCKSAGRVQSAVMRAIIDRQTEILEFIPKPYWTLSSLFKIEDYEYVAELYQWMKKPLEKFMWTEETVKEAKEKLAKDSYQIINIEKKESKRAPNAPFTTSTMQQEAASRYGWSPSKTSSVAQNLYEGVSINGEQMGLVTYIRTDSTRIAEDALADCKKVIISRYGDKYAETKRYTTKSKAAQDGHEAIRPVNFNILPWDLDIPSDQKALYELIWRRTVASQMSSAVYNITNIFIAGHHAEWKIHGREQIFKGFLEVYKIEEPEECISLNIDQKSKVELFKIDINSHSTQPKPQYTEASLIKHMDEVGIGRPSTYAYTLKILEEREYVRKENKKIIPTKKGWIVNGFLDEYCKEYIKDNFTASVEDQLDLIAEGKKQWKEFAAQFWEIFSKIILPINEVESKSIFDIISNKYANYFFGSKDRSCPKCTDGKKILRMLTNGEFIGCSRYPECDWQENDTKSGELIGQDPETGSNVLLKKGQHGPYLHWSNENKNISIPINLLASINMDLAIKLKKLPLLIGKHPGTNHDIHLQIGRYGPYLKYNGTFIAFPGKELDNVSLDKAISIIEAKNNKTKALSDKMSKSSIKTPLKRKVQKDKQNK